MLVLRKISNICPFRYSSFVPVVLARCRENKMPLHGMFSVLVAAAIALPAEIILMGTNHWKLLLPIVLFVIRNLKELPGMCSNFQGKTV